MLKAWQDSKDFTKRAGRPGIDGVTAHQFGAKIDSNLDDITDRLQLGQYGFSKLRTVFIPKPGSDKERVICVPTVRDRLVQRAIAEHLNSKEIFPVQNSSSFGFIKRLGPRPAINRVIELRGRYDWCLKTDIQSFFDRIPRNYLKSQVTQFLKGSSLESLIFQIIECEVKLTNENRDKLRKQGLTAGMGIRQGMPLSPLLANLALSKFDQEVERKRVRMVRYADDLALFFRTKEEAREGQHFIKLLLATVRLSIPEIADGSKTKIVRRDEPLEFLGREVVPLDLGKTFVAQVGQSQIDKIRKRLVEEFSFESRSSKGKDLQGTVVDLSRSIAAYLGIYKDASNYSAFAKGLSALGHSIVAAIFRDMFGQESLQALTPEARKFLGMEALDVLEPNTELDV